MQPQGTGDPIGSGAAAQSVPARASVSNAARDASAEEDPEAAEIDRLIDQLQSLHDSERAVVGLIGHGGGAVPALRRVVFAREPSGLFQARCFAVQALAALGARDVLFAFLAISPRALVDPVERAGEEAVINATARALAWSNDEATFQHLLRLAAQPSLAGVLEALGEFRRPEAIPRCIEALGDDLGRPAAETALRTLGAAARPALVRAAAVRPDADDYEHASSLRRRRSALALLLELGGTAPWWAQLRRVIHDPDAEIAFLACRIGLASAPLPERRMVIARLIELLGVADPLLCAEIEDCLVAHFAIVSGLLREALEQHVPAAEENRAASRCRRAVLRIWHPATGQASAPPSDASGIDSARRAGS